MRKENQVEQQLEKEWFDVEKCRNVFNREKKAAQVAVQELYGDNISKESAHEAKEQLGVEVYQKSLSEIRQFNKELSKRINKIILAEVFEKAEFHGKLNSIGVTLDRAKNQFNWDNPILDYIGEVE